MPKGVYERKPRQNNKREEILKAAAAVYAHYGFEGATIEQMAAKAGVSKSLVLRYFPNKQELVKAIVDWAVTENLSWMNEIDSTPGLTLRHREWLIHRRFAENREQWCLILGTILVPSFQFQTREELTSLLRSAHQTVLEHREELRVPTEESAYAYAYSTISLHIGFVFSGRKESFQQALDHHLDLYLLPEKGE